MTGKKNLEKKEKLMKDDRRDAERKLCAKKCKILCIE